MERLLQNSSSSSSWTPLKPQPKISSSLPRLAHLSSPSLGFPRLNDRRVSSISCKQHQNLSPAAGGLPAQPSVQLDLSNRSKPKPNFVQRIATGVVEQRKFISTGTMILISAITALLLNPIFASPAFATFQTAAKTGSSVGSKLIRTELLSSAWTGFFAGCLHTLSGPDHLAALAPLSIGRTKMESAAVGALWGCGHDAGQVIFGLIFLLLKDKLHIEVLQTWGSRVVGLTLVVIGAMGIREASEAHAPFVALENVETNVSSNSIPERVETPKKKIGFATFATGIVHGLQPDALMIVLPALALPSRSAGAAFLVMFLLGTVFAMGSYTAFIGSCSQALQDRVPKITEKLTWASSLVAIGLGLAIIFSQLFGYSLY